MLPTGQIILTSPFATHLLDHVRMLQSSHMREHVLERARARHVGRLVDALRKS